MKVQCRGTTKRGSRCMITSESKLEDDHGHLIAEPLQKGGSLCRIHAQTFSVHRPEISELSSSAVVLFIDFETTGLDVTRDHIIEIGALDADSGSVFSTVVKTSGSSNAHTVHGIDPSEIAEGPRFPDVWHRFVAFAEGVVNGAIAPDDSDSSAEDVPKPYPMLAENPPALVLAAHNGFRFDFAMLVCECQRYNVSFAPLQRWLFVDTMHVLHSFGDFGECLKLQCLALASHDQLGLRAHRALDDCYALRGVIQRVARRYDLSIWRLFRNFAHELDLEATWAHVATLSRSETGTS